MESECVASLSDVYSRRKFVQCNRPGVIDTVYPAKGKMCEECLKRTVAIWGESAVLKNPPHNQQNENEAA